METCKNFIESILIAIDEKGEQYEDWGKSVKLLKGVLIDSFFGKVILTEIIRPLTYVPERHLLFWKDKDGTIYDDFPLAYDLTVKEKKKILKALPEHSDAQGMEEMEKERKKRRNELKEEIYRLVEEKGVPYRNWPKRVKLPKEEQVTIWNHSLAYIASRGRTGATSSPNLFLLWRNKKGKLDHNFLNQNSLTPEELQKIVNVLKTK